MRAVVQRVTRASVRVDGDEISHIDRGLLVLVGFTDSDNEEVLKWMAHKIVSLRIFQDENGKMNLDLAAVDGKLLVVSQFTLYADCNKGNRPSFIRSAPVEDAELLYDRFVEILDLETAHPVLPGAFQAHMEVDFVNDGPVTLIIDKESA